MNKKTFVVRAPQAGNQRRRAIDGYRFFPLPALFAGLVALIMPILAEAQSGYVIHTVPSSLTSQVNTLVTSATSQQQQLRAASLQWALNEAATQFAAGNPAAITSFLAGDTVTVAAPSGVAPAGTTDLEYSPFGIGDGLVSDVQTNLSNNTQIGSPDTATYPLGLNMFPTIPNYPTGSGGQPVNAVASSVFGEIPNYIDGTALPSYAQQIEEAFGHPQSPYYGDYKLVPLMFNQMEAQYDSAFTNTNGSADFSDAPPLVLQYILVAGRWPDLILPSVAKRWEASIYYTMALYYNYDCSSSPITSSSPAQDGPWLEGDPSLAYPNQDFRICEPMVYAAYVFSAPLNHNNYSANVAANLKAAVNTYFDMALGSAIEFPDGAFTYVYSSNEVGDYQVAETQSLGELYQLMSQLTDTTDKNIRSNAATMLQNARLYFPIEYPSQGFGIFSTAYPAWKMGFTSSAGYEAKGLLYSITPGLSTASDPELWRVFDEMGTFADQDEMDLIAASCIDTADDPFGGSLSAAEATDVDGYFAYDENREGPYVRNGDWTMVGSARMNHCDSRGTACQAGFILNASGSEPGVSVGAPGNAVFTGTAATDYVNTMTSDSQNSTIVQPAFATLAAMSTMAPHSGAALNFDTIQEWIFTPNRMVGFVTLWNPTSSNQTAYGVGGIFDMHGSTDFAAASGSTPRLEYGQYGSAPYSYDMILNVKQNTYGNYVDYDSGTAELLDETTHNEKSYAPGVVGDYVVDFHPAAQSDAAEAKSISTGITGVFGLEVEEGTQMYRLIHNTTSSPVTYTAALPSSMWGSNSVTVHSAEVPAVNGSTVNNIPSEPEIVGETYRPAWMDPNGSDSWSPALPVNLSLAGGTVSVTVPPNSHILLMSDTSTLLASWINTDIGDAAVPGSSSYSNGTYTLQGSGSDIWDAIDGFQYDYQGLNGNGAIVAHLASLSTGKAGVMIRETLSGDSSYVDMVINSKQAKFEYRAGTGNNARSGASSAVENVPAWLKLVRSGNTFTGYYGPDGINWTEMGTGITDTMNASLSLGLVETSQNNSTLGTATFDNVNILPDGTWAAQDIGSVAIAGYSRYNQSVVTMSGEGADIYGGADAFHYEYQTLSGNGTITARVTGVQNTNNAAKVGVMIRETLNPGATNAFMLISAENGINSQWRSTTNGGTSQGTGVSGISTPYWLRVSRSGNTFTMSYSSNGTTWTTSSTPTITMATNAYIGLAVCSHNTAEACMATVDNITTSN